MSRQVASREAARRGARRGVALPAALGALALLSALAVAGVAAARDELRAAQALAAGARARAAAEGSVAWEGARWDVARNLRLAVGGVEETAPPVGADAAVRTVRTGTRTFLLDGRATVPAGPPGGGGVATRRVRLLVRLPHLVPRLEGAVTVAGALVVADGAAVSGVDAPPEGWGDCGRWGDVPGALSAVAGSSADAVRIWAGASVRGGVRVSAAAGLPASYVRVGEGTWEALVARAAVVVDGGGAWTPTPGGAGDRCDAGWGEPRRGGGAVAACERSSPIVHARGAALALSGPARGQGVLLVDGDLRVAGDVEWAGLVVVRGSVHAAGGALRIRGALMIANADGRGASELGPGSDVTYSGCAVARAAIAAARPVPLRRRAWSEVTR